LYLEFEKGVFILRAYDFQLTNNEEWQLFTDKTLKEVKEYIENNKWITLSYYQYGEKDIQTCNIIWVKEDIDYQKMIDEIKQSKKDRLEIIHKIERYKFNWRMKWWFNKTLMWTDKDEDLEHPYLAFNKEFLNEVLEKCKKYKCKLKEG
jgi:hypothetical protein